MHIIKYTILLLSGIGFLSCQSSGKDSDPEENPGTPEQTETAEPVSGIRIAWDYSSLKQISEVNDTGYNGYPRLIQLQDGSLMVTYESHGNVLVKKSTDNGENWSSAVTVAAYSGGVNMATPDILQLQNGTILITYNPRPSSTASPTEKFLIKTILSNDNGLTWVNDQVVYEGDTLFENGVWEPSAVQLPGGEIQLFFSNEYMYPTSNEQNISMLRSTDNGVNWSTEPVIASFRPGSRDGMPSPLYLDDQNMVVFSIEDNGNNNQFKPYTIRNSVTQNWSETVNANSQNRAYALDDPLESAEYAGAPYLARLGTGEVLLSYQGTDNRNGTDLNNADMKVAIGNTEAKNFNRTSTPFIIPEGKSALWSSISVINNSTVAALTTTNAFSSTGAPQVWMIQGKIIPEITAVNGSLTIDGETTESIWQQPFPVFIGHKSTTQARVNLMANNESLFIITGVKDSNISAYSSAIQNNDGMVLYLDPQNKSYVAPGQGVFKIVISATNQIKVYEGNNGLWVETDLTGIDTETKNVSGGYVQEISIPWNSLGGKPQTATRIGFNVELNERGSTNYSEMPTATQKDAPYTWLSLKL